MNLKRLRATATKEIREMLRDRFFLILAFISPPVMMVIFGYGMNLDVENIPFVIVDYDNTPQSRDYASHYTESRYFHFLGYVTDEREAQQLLLAARIRVAIIIPEHFGRRLAQGRSTAIQTLLDGANPLRANMTKSYIIAINSQVSLQQITDFMATVRGLHRSEAEAMLQPVRFEVRYLYNQGAKSRWSMVPKMIMMVLMMAPPFLTAVGVVREKERGSILNIYSSTVTKAEFLIGKLSPYAVVTAINGLVLWVIATQLFAIPFKGSFLFFMLATLAYTSCTTGIGLLVSLFVSTQAAAIVVTMIVTMIPAMLYSGIIIPLSSMGPLPRFMALFTPAMHYTQIVDGTFLKGQGFLELWRPLVVLAGYGMILFAIGHRLFTKRPRA